MKKMNPLSRQVDEYISRFPEETRVQLEKMRALIQKAAPGATEIISYGMPAYKQHGVLVYFAGNKNHIGFYPTAEPIKVFARDLEKYKTTKGAVQFPIDKPLPAQLLTRMVKYRVKADAEKQKVRKK